MSIEESKRNLEEFKANIADIRKKVNEYTEEVCIYEESKYAIPIAEEYLKKLREENLAFENSVMPEILEGRKGTIRVYLKWFLEQEKLYPNASWLIVGGAKNKLIQLDNRYNELLYLMCKKQFDRYKTIISELVTIENKTEQTEIMLEAIDQYRCFVQVDAGNAKECFNSFNELHYEVEEIYSNLNI